MTILPYKTINCYMKILHVLLTRMPVPPPKYGGTERVLWALYLGQKAKLRKEEKKVIA